MEKHSLAIVIPAYKADFFEETMASLEAQTCHDFNVYICNDAGDEEIGLIAQRYSNRLSLTYQYCQENLGQSDLVAQWERAVSMMCDEEFFILFSDDDIMEPGCVEAFYQVLATCPASDVYHFNISFIDEHSELICNNPDYPEVISAQQFYIENNIRSRIVARMPEFIFRTERFRETGGFVGFPYAMGTDNAMVINVGMTTGIRTITGHRIRWRYSAASISSNKSHREKQLKIMQAEAELSNWAHAVLFSSGQELSTRLRWCECLVFLRKYSNPLYDVTLFERMRIMSSLNHVYNNLFIKFMLAVLIFVKKVLYILRGKKIIC